MVSTYTTNKAIEKPANNSYIGTWNVPINSDWDIIDSAFGGTYNVSLSNANVTLTQANVQNTYISLTGTLTANVTVYFPSGVAGFYIVGNFTSGSYTVTLASAGGGLLTVNATSLANTFIWSTGTNIFLASNAGLSTTYPLSLTGSVLSLSTVPVSKGGTGTVTYSDGQLLIGNSATNGLTVATLTAGPNITITNGNGTVTIAASGTGGGGGGAQTYTGLQTFTGTTTNLAELLTNAGEVVSLTGTGLSGTFNYDVTTQSVAYSTGNATANWTVNFRGSSSSTLNSIMSAGQSVTVAHLVTCGGTAYYNNAVQIDGTSVTPVWQGGSAPSSGFASSLNVYTYTIIKTASSTFSVLASLTQFA
jgi:hypothetical protein